MTMSMWPTNYKSKRSQNELLACAAGCGCCPCPGDEFVTQKSVCEFEIADWVATGGAGDPYVHVCPNPVGSDAVVTDVYEDVAGVFNLVVVDRTVQAATVTLTVPNAASRFDGKMVLIG